MDQASESAFSNFAQQSTFGGSMGGLGNFLGNMMGAAGTLAMLFPVLLMGFGIADSIGLGDLFTDTMGSAGGFSLYEIFGTSDLSKITIDDYNALASDYSDWSEDDYTDMDFGGIPQIEII
jgi:hypothetical protein